MHLPEQPSASSLLTLAAWAASVAFLGLLGRECLPEVTAWVAEELPRLSDWVEGPTEEPRAPDGDESASPPEPAVAEPPAVAEAAAPLVAASFAAPELPPAPLPSASAEPTTQGPSTSAAPSAEAPPSEPSPSPAPVAVAVPELPADATLLARGAAVLRPIASFPVSEGSEPDQVWTPSFHLHRDEGDTQLSLVEAQERCAKQGAALCTETQWRRACSVDPTIGSMETWTMSAAGPDRVVVRGGELGCQARGESALDARSSNRAGVCCERAIGVKSDMRRTGFLRASARRMLSYEQALRQHDVASLRKRFRESVRFFGMTLNNDEIGARSQAYFEGHSDAWAVIDVCDSTLVEPATLVDVCRLISFRSGEVGFVTQRFVHSGKDSRIEELSETDVLRSFTRP